eukprot:g11448.t1
MVPRQRGAPRLGEALSRDRVPRAAARTSPSTGLVRACSLFAIAFRADQLRAEATTSLLRAKKTKTNFVDKATNFLDKAMLSAFSLKAPGDSRKDENMYHTYTAMRNNDWFPHENPYTPDRPFRMLDDLEPVAPLSELGYEEEKEAQLNSAGQGADYVFLPKYRYGVPFPTEHVANEPKLPTVATAGSALSSGGDASTAAGEQQDAPLATPTSATAATAQLACVDAPATFADSSNRGCVDYQVRQYCTTAGAAGAGWTAEASAGATIESFADAGGVNALQACCACGGGAKQVVVGNPIKGLDSPDRRIFAPFDKMPVNFYPLKSRSGYTTYGAHPQPYRSKDPVAPADDIDEKYRLYFSQLHDRETLADPGGLSAEFFSVASQPADWVNGWKPTNVLGTGVAPFVDFREQSNELRWPSQQGGGEPKMWWVRFSGTLNILQAGEYMFDVAPGSETLPTTLLVDGQQEQCAARGCTVDGDEKCVTADTATMLRNLPQGGHCLQLFARVRNSMLGKSVALRYLGPDTDGGMATVPAAMLSCNPEVATVCRKPARNACGGEGATEAAAVAS